MSSYPPRILLGLWCGVLAAAVAQAQGLRPDSGLVAGLDALVAKHGIDSEGPGVAVLVRQPGQPLVLRGYGLANLRTRAPVTPRTRFYLASLSKSFTAAAVLLLYERGQFALQDDVRAYLPELPGYGNGIAIRIRDLLQHTSGLPEYLDWPSVPARHRGYRVGEDYLAELARRGSSLPLRFSPGQKYEYSNTNYVLLALVVKRVAKKSFGTFLHDEVFVPAGMKDAFVHEHHDAAPAHATPGVSDAVGYERGKDGVPWRESWATPPTRREALVPVGDGGVWCHLEDLARWDAALRGGKILKPATLRLALTPSETGDGKRNNYGLGWSLYFNQAGRMIGYGHRGLWRGFRTNYYDYLLEDRTTAILTNRADFDPNRFWYALDGVIENHRSPR